MRRKKGNDIIRFAVVLLISLSVLYVLHDAVFRHFGTGFRFLLYYTYPANYILAIFITSVIVFLSGKYPHLTGFMFMGGSMLKFLIFFLFFYPMYHDNGANKWINASSFLIPYLLCLIFETRYLSRLLNTEL